MKLLLQSADCDLYQGCNPQPGKATGPFHVVCRLDDDIREALARGCQVVVRVTPGQATMEVWAEEDKPKKAKKSTRET